MVKLASSLMYGSAITDSQERINVARMREERAGKLKKAMKKHGIPACLLARNDNVRYATGIHGAAYIHQLRYVLFFAEHDPIVFEHAGQFQHYTDQAPWIKNWRIARSWLGSICGAEATKEEAALFAAEILDELKQKGLAHDKLGITAFDGPGVAALNEAGIKTTDCWPLMLEARTVKTQDEINCMKMSVAVGDIAWYQVYDAIKPGIRDRDLLAIASKVINENSSESGEARMAVWSGPNTFERGFYCTDRIIQCGDILYCDMHSNFLGYQTCFYRTFMVGREPTQKEKDWYQIVLERQNAVLDAIKPGATTADAAKHFPPASRWGYPNEVYVLTVEIGHGVGLYLYEMPVINRLWSLKHPQVFQEGMTMSIESMEGEHRVGGARLEDQIVITKDGAELLSHTPREQIMVAHRMV